MNKNEHCSSRKAYQKKALEEDSIRKFRLTMFFYFCDKRCQGKVICNHDHFIWCGTEVGEEGGEDKLMFG